MTVIHKLAVTTNNSWFLSRLKKYRAINIMVTKTAPVKVTAHARNPTNQNRFPEGHFPKYGLHSKVVAANNAQPSS